MRIACLYLPSFTLQVEVRRAPHLAGRPIAVASSGERPIVLCCSRAAHALGVRPGITMTQARAIAPATGADALEVIVGQAEGYRAALAALAEVLMAHSVTVDIGDDALGASQALYLHVPPSHKSARFAAELGVELGRQGYRGRVGVADDRFTAWAAAVTGKAPVTVVPRGEAAGFLAPLPLELLPLGAEVRPLFAALGMKTLGAFAALPPPSVGRRFQGAGLDYQELARGEGPRFLRGYVPREPVVERFDLEHELDALEPLSFVLRSLADRVCQRLRGRGTAAARVAIVLRGRAAGGAAGARVEQEVVLAPSRPTLSSRTLLDLARAKLGERGLDRPVETVELRVVDEGVAESETLDLFGAGDRGRAVGEGVDVAIARLEAVFGEAATGAAELTDSHRPEASFRLTPFTGPERKGARRSAGRHSGGRVRAAARAPHLPLAANHLSGALRLVEPPALQPGAPGAIQLGGAAHPVIATHGPTRIETEWWSDDPVERDYYEVETADGGRYWVFRRRSDGQFYLHGIFD